MDGISFYINSVLLGIGLAMDAFSVSIADGLDEPSMKKRKGILIAFTFALYQFIMPVIGYVLVHNLAEKFTKFQKFIPYIALILLLYIGGSMLIEGIKGKSEEVNGKLTFKVLMIQGIATSIDALSVGFTISDYNMVEALVSALIIAMVTFVICMVGIYIGKKLGDIIKGKASIVGGIILIAIGIEIFIKGVF